MGRRTSFKDRFKALPGNRQKDSLPVPEIGILLSEKRQKTAWKPGACGPENGEGGPKRGTGACKNQGPLCRFEQSLSILKDPLIGVILLHSTLKNACFA